MKKVFSILLVSTMLVALLAGCGGTAPEAADTPAPATEEPTPAPEAPEPENPEAPPEENEVKYPLTDQPTTFTLWYSFPGDLADIMQTYLGEGQNSVLQAVEEKTGVNLEFMFQSVMTANENFNLLVASGDYPELFHSASSYYTGGIDKAVDDHILLDITDMIPEYAPNYNTLVREDAATLSSATTSSGKMVEIYRLMKEYTKPSTGLVIRQDWLDDLSLDTPVTLEDYHNVLLAFKEEKGAAEPLGLGGTGIFDENEICSAFGVNGVYADFMGKYPYYVVDDQVKFGWVEDGFKEYLTMMNQWYNEGLIGKDFYVENIGHGIDSSKTTTGKCGIWLNDYFQIEFIESLMADENADIRAVAAPVKEAGDTLHFADKKTLLGGNAWSITMNCTQPELALQYIDFFFTEEGSTLCNYGVEGEGMEFDADGNPQYTELIYANPDHMMRETQVMYTLTVGPFVEIESRSDVAYSEKAIEARSIWESNIDDAYSMPTTELSAEQAEEFTKIMGDLMTYASGKITEFIIGNDSIDNWDAYIAQMEALNVGRTIEIYQEVYDAAK